MNALRGQNETWHTGQVNQGHGGMVTSAPYTPWARLVNLAGQGTFGLIEMMRNA